MKLSSRPLLDTKAHAALFVNREHELQRLKRSLDVDLNCLVLGHRGSGRTTLLRRLAYQMRVSWSQTHVFIEGAVVDDAVTFLSLLRFRLLGDQRISAGEALSRTARAGGQLLSGQPTIPLASPRHETEELLSLYRQVHAAAEAKAGCVVLVDEIRAAELTHTIFGRFRDETWQLPLRWVVAGDIEARATYLAPPADAFFESVVELAPLSDEAAAELLCRRVEDSTLDADALSTVIELAEGNPQRLLAYARRVVVDGVPVEELAALREWKAARLAEMGPAAARLLYDLDEFGPASASDPVLLRRLGWTRGRAAQVFRQLERSGLVRASRERSPAGGPDRKVFEPIGAGR